MPKEDPEFKRAAQVASEARTVLADLHQALRDANAALLEPLLRASDLLGIHASLHREFRSLCASDSSLVDRLKARGIRLNAVSYPALTGRPTMKGGEDYPEPFGDLLVMLIETAAGWRRRTQSVLNQQP